MKIGIIAHIQHPINRPFAGGLETFTYNIAKLFKLRSHEVVLFASSLSDASLGLYPILDDTHYDRQQGLRSKNPGLASIYIDEHHAYMNLMMSIDELNLDVIFNNSLHYVPITMSNMVKTPMLTALHTPPFFELKKAIERDNSNNRYVTVSNSNRKQWRSSLSRCDVIYNGIDLSQWDFYEKNTGAYAVWFGRIHPDKGLEHAIEACRLANKPLKIIGNISDQRYYERVVKPLIHDGVEFLGHRNHADINRLVGNASCCLVTPNWEEPFGLVVAESLACGTPVIAFKKGALPELINASCGVLVDYKRTDLLAEGIEEAPSFDRKACRATAEAYYDIEKMASYYLDILMNMANP